LIFDVTKGEAKHRSFQFWIIHMANRLVSGSRDNPIELTMKQDGKPGIRRRYKGRRLQGSKYAIRADVYDRSKCTTTSKQIVRARTYIHSAYNTPVGLHLQWIRRSGVNATNESMNCIGDARRGATRGSLRFQSNLDFARPAGTCCLVSGCRDETRWAETDRSCKVGRST
jgi:hypothetical protein